MTAALRPNQVDYRIHANVDYEPATCEEINCEHYLKGWVSAFDETTDLGQGQAHFIRHGSGRPFREYPAREWNAKVVDALAAEGRDPAEFTPLPDTLTVFEFTPGQPCFKAVEHKKTRATNPLFLVRDIEGLLRRHSGADPWADDLRTHQDNLLGKLD